MQIRTFLIAISSILTALALTWGYLIIQLQRQVDRLQMLEQNRHEMLMKADELRHSSDDLTRFARTYVITGNENYKDDYFKVLDIRNGRALKPEGYAGIYWDISEPLRTATHPLGQAGAIEDEMQKLPYSEFEFKKLKEAKINSDDLVGLEVEAFNAMQGLYKDEDSQYRVHARPDQAMAISLLHSEQYHKAKEKIMFPLDEFSDSLSERTDMLINEANDKLKSLYLGIDILLILGGGIFLLTLFMMYKKVLLPISRLTKAIQLFNKGEDNIYEPAVTNDEFGVMVHQFFTMKEKLDMIADTDSLTQIQNRRSFFEISEQILKLSQRTHETFSILMLDIDFFKNVNDRYGHIIGDEILKYLAIHIKGFLRKSDLFARYGGEEFIVLLPKTDISRSLEIAEKIRLIFENNPYSNGKLTLPITVSIGAAEYKDEKQIQELIQKADEALYQAKDEGRNRVILAD